MRHLKPVKCDRELRAAEPVFHFIALFEDSRVCPVQQVWIFMTPVAKPDISVHSGRFDDPLCEIIRARTDVRKRTSIPSVLKSWLRACRVGLRFSRSDHY